MNFKELLLISFLLFQRLHSILLEELSFRHGRHHSKSRQSRHSRRTTTAWMSHAEGFPTPYSHNKRKAESSRRHFIQKPVPPLIIRSDKRKVIGRHLIQKPLPYINLRQPLLNTRITHPLLPPPALRNRLPNFHPQLNRMNLAAKKQVPRLTSGIAGPTIGSFVPPASHLPMFRTLPQNKKPWQQQLLQKRQPRPRPPLVPRPRLVPFVVSKPRAHIVLRPQPLPGKKSFKNLLQDEIFDNSRSRRGKVVPDLSVPDLSVPDPFPVPDHPIPAPAIRKSEHATFGSIPSDPKPLIEYVDKGGMVDLQPATLSRRLFNTTFKNYGDYVNAVSDAVYESKSQQHAVTLVKPFAQQNSRKPPGAAVPPSNIKPPRPYPQPNLKISGPTNQVKLVKQLAQFNGFNRTTGGQKGGLKSSSPNPSPFGNPSPDQTNQLPPNQNVAKKPTNNTVFDGENDGDKPNGGDKQNEAESFNHAFHHVRPAFCDIAEGKDIGDYHVTICANYKGDKVKGSKGDNVADRVQDLDEQGKLKENETSNDYLETFFHKANNLPTQNNTKDIATLLSIMHPAGNTTTETGDSSNGRAEVTPKGSNALSGSVDDAWMQRLLSNSTKSNASATDALSKMANHREADKDTAPGDRNIGFTNSTVTTNNEQNKAVPNQNNVGLSEKNSDSKQPTQEFDSSAATPMSSPLSNATKTPIVPSNCSVVDTSTADLLIEQMIQHDPYADTHKMYNIIPFDDVKCSRSLNLASVTAEGKYNITYNNTKDVNSNRNHSNADGNHFNVASDNTTATNTSNFEGHSKHEKLMELHGSQYNDNEINPGDKIVLNNTVKPSVWQSYDIVKNDTRSVKSEFGESSKNGPYSGEGVSNGTESGGSTSTAPDPTDKSGKFDDMKVKSDDSNPGQVTKGSLENQGTTDLTVLSINSTKNENSNSTHENTESKNVSEEKASVSNADINKDGSSAYTNNTISRGSSSSDGNEAIDQGKMEPLPDTLPTNTASFEEGSNKENSPNTDPNSNTNQGMNESNSDNPNKGMTPPNKGITPLKTEQGAHKNESKQVNNYFYININNYAADKNKAHKDGRMEVTDKFEPTPIKAMNSSDISESAANVKANETSRVNQSSAMDIQESKELKNTSGDVRNNDVGANAIKDSTNDTHTSEENVTMNVADNSTKTSNSAETESVGNRLMQKGNSYESRMEENQNKEIANNNKDNQSNENESANQVENLHQIRRVKWKKLNNIRNDNQDESQSKIGDTPVNSTDNKMYSNSTKLNQTMASEDEAVNNANISSGEKLKQNETKVDSENFVPSNKSTSERTKEIDTGKDANKPASLNEEQDNSKTALISDDMKSLDAINSAISNMMARIDRTEKKTDLILNATGQGKPKENISNIIINNSNNNNNSSNNKDDNNNNNNNIINNSSNNKDDKKNQTSVRNTTSARTSSADRFVDNATDAIFDITKDTEDYLRNMMRKNQAKTEVQQQTTNLPQIVLNDDKTNVGNHKLLAETSDTGATSVTAALTKFHSAYHGLHDVLKTLSGRPWDNNVKDEDSGEPVFKVASKDVEKKTKKKNENTLEPANEEDVSQSNEKNSKDTSPLHKKDASNNVETSDSNEGGVDDKAAPIISKKTEKTENSDQEDKLDVAKKGKQINDKNIVKVTKANKDEGVKGNLEDSPFNEESSSNEPQGKSRGSIKGAETAGISDTNSRDTKGKVTSSTQNSQMADNEATTDDADASEHNAVHSKDQRKIKAPGSNIETNNDDKTEDQNLEQNKAIKKLKEEIKEHLDNAKVDAKEHTKISRLEPNVGKSSRVEDSTTDASTNVKISTQDESGINKPTINNEKAIPTENTQPNEHPIKMNGKPTSENSKKEEHKEGKEFDTKAAEQNHPKVSPDNNLNTEPGINKPEISDVSSAQKDPSHTKGVENENDVTKENSGPSDSTERNVKHVSEAESKDDNDGDQVTESSHLPSKPPEGVIHAQQRLNKSSNVNEAFSNAPDNTEGEMEDKKMGNEDKPEASDISHKETGKKGGNEDNAETSEISHKETEERVTAHQAKVASSEDKAEGTSDKKPTLEDQDESSKSKTSEPADKKPIHEDHSEAAGVEQEKTRNSEPSENDITKSRPSQSNNVKPSAVEDTGKTEEKTDSENRKTDTKSASESSDKDEKKITSQENSLLPNIDSSKAVSEENKEVSGRPQESPKSNNEKESGASQSVKVNVDSHINMPDDRNKGDKEVEQYKDNNKEEKNKKEDQKPAISHHNVTEQIVSINESSTNQSIGVPTNKLGTRPPSLESDATEGPKQTLKEILTGNTTQPDANTKKNQNSEEKSQNKKGSEDKADISETLEAEVGSTKPFNPNEGELKLTEPDETKPPSSNETTSTDESKPAANATIETGTNYYFVGTYKQCKNRCADGVCDIVPPPYILWMLTHSNDTKLGDMASICVSRRIYDIGSVCTEIGDHETVRNILSMRKFIAQPEHAYVMDQPGHAHLIQIISMYGGFFLDYNDRSKGTYLTKHLEEFVKLIDQSSNYLTELTRNYCKQQLRSIASDIGSLVDVTRDKERRKVYKEMYVLIKHRLQGLGLGLDDYGERWFDSLQCQIENQDVLFRPSPLKSRLSEAPAAKKRKVEDIIVFFKGIS